jgi:uncharacterized protein YabN with tetrapyrrole methylase and pyrophosphatase domain
MARKIMNSPNKEDEMTALDNDGIIQVPWNLTVPRADIHLVGYGMRLPNDLTLEALGVLKNCKRIFGIPPIHAPEFGIPEMENLWLRYGANKSRRATYQEWLELILDAATTNSPVALATCGSPMVGALVSHQILEEAPRRGLTVHVTNSVSCFDGIWADLNIEPFFGFSVWEATAFVRLAVEPDTQTNLLLPQAPVFEVTTGPDVHNFTMQTSSTLAALRDHLLRFYPPEHEVHFVQTATGTDGIGPVIETLPLSELDQPGRSMISTLLIPRLAPDGKLDFQSAHRAAKTPATNN